MSKQRQQQKAETRQKILKSTRKLCARNGFTQTRTLDVAKAARVSHGSVFVHFESRDKLISAVVAELVKEVTDELYAAVEDNASIKDVLGVHLDCLAERETEFRWLLLEVPFLSKECRASWIGAQSAISHYISSAFSRAGRDAGIKALPMHFIFNAWVGLVNHYVINRDVFAPRRSVLKDRRAEILDGFLKLVS